MEPNETLDPGGTYDTDEVRVTVDGDEITKGDGATGTFLMIGPNRTRFTTRTGADGAKARARNPDFTRAVSVVLTRLSPANAVLRRIQETGHVARVRVERRPDGAVLMDDVEIVTVDDVRDVGSSERRWDVTVYGCPE